MPTIKNQLTAATANALADETLAEINQTSAITLVAVAQTITDRIQLFHNQEALMNSVQPNLLADADAGPDTSKDILLDREIVQPGKLSMPATAVAAQLSYIILIQPIVG